MKLIRNPWWSVDSVPTDRRARADRGYSLIEVLVGVSLLAVVAMTITGLFAKGRKEVASGRNMTSALSVAQHVAEDLDNVSYFTLIQGWDLNGATAAGKTVTSTETNARIQVLPNAAGNGQVTFIAPLSSTGTAAASTPCTLSTTVPSDCLLDPLRNYARKWSEELSKIPASELVITMTCFFDMDENSTTSPSLPGGGSGAPMSPYAGTFYVVTSAGAAAGGAEFIRIDVTVNWIEEQRRRSVTVPQMRTYNEV